MQISLDARWLRTGIGRYIEGLLGGLKGKLNDFELHVLTMNEYSSRLRTQCDHISFYDSPIYSLQEQFGVPWNCRQSDLLHVPHYNVPLVWNKKLVVTIHDTTHLENPASYAASIYARPMLRAAVKKADAIITVSETAKKRLIDCVSAPEHKFHVIYLGVDPAFRPGSKIEARRKLGEDFPTGSLLLAGGNSRPHKNLANLILAFEMAARSLPPDWKLLLVSDGADKLLKPTQFHQERILIKSDVAEEQLRLLYQAADAFIMPSLNEGFGLPVIEAMASGLPVLCADIDVFREVAADAAHYFDPRDNALMSRAIVELLSNADCLRTLAAKGLSRAPLFSWNTCGQKHADVYRLLLQRS